MNSGLDREEKNDENKLMSAKNAPWDHTIMVLKM